MWWDSRGTERGGGGKWSFLLGLPVTSVPSGLLLLKRGGLWFQLEPRLCGINLPARDWILPKLQLYFCFAVQVDPPDGSSAGLTFGRSPLESRRLLLLRGWEFTNHSDPAGLGRTPRTPGGAELHALTHWESSACCVSLISKEMSVREGTSPLLGSSWSAYQTGAFAEVGGQGRRQLLAWKGRERSRQGSRWLIQHRDGLELVQSRALGSLPTVIRLHPQRCWGDISLGCAVAAGGGSRWDTMPSLGAGQLTAVPCQVPASLCIGISRV